jgi:tetratricopeptide (TPR) repeat protein
LLQLDLAENPAEPFINFNLGWTYEQRAQPTEALPYLQRSLQRSHPSASIVRKLYTLIMECHRRLGDRKAALAVCQEGKCYYPDDTQLLFQEAILQREEANLGAAEKCLQHLIDSRDNPQFASVAEGLRSWQARHNLAVIYRDQGRDAEAEAQWKATVQEQPSFALAWLGLGELYLAQKRYADVEAIISRLEKGDGHLLPERLDPTGSGGCCAQKAPVPFFVGAKVLRARLNMARKDFASARSLLEGAIGRAPGEVLLWEVLSHALLQEGSDCPAAERALRKVLELDPANPEARRNLALLRREEVVR